MLSRLHVLALLIAAGSGVSLLGCESDVETRGTGGTSTGSGASGTGAGATGGESQGGAGANSTGGSGTGGTGTGGDALDLSECETNANCGGLECVDLHGGYHVCQQLVTEATACTGSGLDECCDTSECTSPAKCLEAPLKASCGGAAPEIYNTCATDECATDADCNAGSICAPAGTVDNKVAICFTAECSGFCGQENPSPCALVRDSCCQAPIGFFCLPKGGCVTNADCGSGYCEMGVCMSGSPPCPP